MGKSVSSKCFESSNSVFRWDVLQIIAVASGLQVRWPVVISYWKGCSESQMAEPSLGIWHREWRVMIIVSVWDQRTRRNQTQQRSHFSRNSGFGVCTKTCMCASTPLHPFTTFLWGNYSPGRGETWAHCFSGFWCACLRKHMLLCCSWGQWRYWDSL